MASFDYASYAATVAAASNKEKATNKIGFFKIGDGEEALVRFNVSSVEDLDFASIHRVKRTPEDRFCGMSISCLNPIGKTGECPLCAAVDAGDDRVQKVGKRVYVQLIVAYKDSSTGKFQAPVPVIFERPAGFYKELVTLLNEYGDLKQNLFKIVRTGAALDTKYSILYAAPAVFKPELVPADFAAFDGFNIAKHSYWEKTVEECEEYLRTGKFPEAVKTDAPIASPAKTVAEVAAKVAEAPAVIKETPTADLPIEATQTAAPVKEEPKPATTGNFGSNFGGFSF